MITINNSSDFVIQVCLKNIMWTECNIVIQIILLYINCIVLYYFYKYRL